MTELELFFVFFIFEVCDVLALAYLPLNSLQYNNCTPGKAKLKNPSHPSGVYVFFFFIHIDYDLLFMFLTWPPVCLSVKIDR